MSELLVKVKEKGEIGRLERHGRVVHAFRYLPGLAVVDVPHEKVAGLLADSDVLSVREGDEAPLPAPHDRRK